jgi:hypothetical protein
MDEARASYPEAGTVEHFVQFYKADEPSLNRNVANFLWNGLLRGDGLLVIATAQRRESLAAHLTRLGADVAFARRDGQLAMVDAHEMLARFMVDGQPDWELFQGAINDGLQLVGSRVAEGGVCAYGEMVGVLWEEGQTEAAIRLEEFWNRFLHGRGLSLFCGYPIDVFDGAFQEIHIHDVLCAHSHVMPTGINGDLRAALDKAMDELLGDGAEGVRSSIKAGIRSANLALPETESAILWLRSHVPDRAEAILSCARSYYEAAQAAGRAAEPRDFVPEALSASQ